MFRTPTRFAMGLFAVMLLGVGLRGARADDSCFFKGKMFSDGATACQAGSQFKCDDGDWKALKKPCADEPMAASKNCEFRGISYSTGSASCQEGVQHRCED